MTPSDDSIPQFLSASSATARKRGTCFSRLYSTVPTFLTLAPDGNPMNDWNFSVMPSSISLSQNTYFGTIQAWKRGI